MRNALLLALLLPITAQATDYVQAPRSALAFSGKYQGELFTGIFPKFQTRMTFDPADLASAKLDVSIPLAYATTANADYDTELRGSAFFDADKFPQAHFTATRFRALGDNRFAADGELNLHGVRKPVTLEFSWTAGVQPVLVGKSTVKRLDFNIGGGEWADTSLIPDAIAVATRVELQPAK